MSDVLEVEATPLDVSVAGALHKSELDQQITMAWRRPRSLTKFLRDAESMITMSEDVAADCIFAVPRGGKTVEGPSVRLAEIVVSAWGNCRAGARIMEEGDKFVTAQGFFIDLERNTAVYREVRRRITDRNGRRYNDDMITMTANAAASIAMRNAITVGVPKAVWWGLYLKARKVVAGDAQTLPDRRAKVLDLLQKVGVPVDRVVGCLGLHAANDITIDHLVTLHGLYCSIRDGEVTPELAFPVTVKESPKEDGLAPPTKGVAGLGAALAEGPVPPSVDHVVVPAPTVLTSGPPGAPTEVPAMAAPATHENPVAVAPELPLGAPSGAPGRNKTGRR